jgi:drug/metabolite transporter (DMT)-like permease
MASAALDAWDVTALRFAVAGLLLLPLLARRGLQGLRPRQALLLACGAGAPYVLLTAGGLAFAPAGHMGVITPSTMLLCSTLGSAWLLSDRLTRSRVLGVTAITVGLVALGWDGFANHGELTWLGDAMFLLGGLFWASYTLASRAWRVDPLHVTAVVAVLSMVLYLPAYLAGAGAGAALAAAPWRDIVVQAVFQGVLSAVVALLLYTRAVAILGPR